MSYELRIWLFEEQSRLLAQRSFVLKRSGPLSLLLPARVNKRWGKVQGSEANLRFLEGLLNLFFGL
jgi:hypothetical protein